MLKNVRLLLQLLLIALLLTSIYSVFSTSTTNLAAQQPINWKIAITPQFDDANSFSEGLAKVGTGKPVDNAYGFKDIDNYGYIDLTGKVVIPLQFKQAGRFSSGLAWIGIDSDGNGNVERYGYIDKTGKTVIEPQFEDAGNFSSGLAPVKIDNKWGYINKQGKVMISPQFDSASEFAQGLAVVGKETEDPDYSYQQKYGYINQKGQLVLPFKFSIAYSFSEGLAAAESQSGKNKGYINRQGKFVINRPQFDTYVLGNFSSGLAVVEVNGGACSAANYCDYGYINKTGNLVIKSPKNDADFTGAQSFSEGLGAVATSGGGRDAGGWYPATNWGYLDKNGKLVISPQFDDAGSFAEGLAPVAIQGKYGYISIGPRIVKSY
ncbi:WG repeat-containing protein [Crocosphaera sp. UHCC 0190]|uniref:WG repeat-containing protein n=1 Tax=Crocosphaera sp. UHCC 0190 TaxID=3110246 RepID=UPI002B20ADC5|nr:WG repeat-containing protein [Crocosphaera sp. UHCC 0190]MEA5511773.1 WG repeat-containing protein [Crocosphaera sp. UHCC 0190]